MLQTENMKRSALERKSSMLDGVAHARHLPIPFPKLVQEERVA